MKLNENKWYKFNDSTVRLIVNNAYFLGILFVVLCFGIIDENIFNLHYFIIFLRIYWIIKLNI